MAKKSSTLHLDTNDWDKINNYQEKNGLSSRNDAISKILLEWELLNKMLTGKEIVKPEVKIKQEVKEIKAVDDIDNSIDDIFNSLK